MSTARHRLFDPFCAPESAQAIRALCTRFGAYGVYVEGPTQSGFGAGLIKRHDAAMNHLVRGDRFGRLEDAATAAARMNIFRGTFFRNGESFLSGIESLVGDETLIESCRRLTGRSLVRPTMVYANVFVSGQELPLHTDTPEYRGLDKWKVPEWFCVVMQHSGLFERWRKSVAAAVLYFNDCAGGDFVLYPDGPEGPVEAVPARFNTAISLDADGTFHGVDRVGGHDVPAPPVEPGMKLAYSEGESRWQLTREGAAVASYGWDEVRLSIQWKANCYVDEAEEALVHSHADDLTQAQVIETLVEDLRARGRITAERPADTALAVMMIDEYVRFPGAAQAAS